MADRVAWFLWTGAALGWSLMVLGIVGEVLGWWNDFGEVLSIVGAVVGTPLTCIGVVWSASRKQVQLVATGVIAANGKLDTIDQKLGKLDRLDALEEHTELLREIRDRL